MTHHFLLIAVSGKLLGNDVGVRQKNISKGLKEITIRGIIHISQMLKDGEDISSSRIKWEKDLECTFEQDTWELICKSALTFSFNSRHRLIQFNIIHRIYYTPER